MDFYLIFYATIGALILMGLVYILWNACKYPIEHCVVDAVLHAEELPPELLDQLRKWSDARREKE